MGGSGSGNAHLQGGHTGNIGLIGGLTALAHNDLIDLGGVDAGTVQAALHDGTCQIIGADGTQCARELAHCSTAAVYHNYITKFHWKYFLSLLMQ